MDKSIVAIIGVVLLVAIALFQGIDGYCYGLGIAAIAGLGGFSMGGMMQKKKGKKEGDNGTGISGT